MPPREAGRYNKSTEWGGSGEKPGGEGAEEVVLKEVR